MIGYVKGRVQENQQDGKLLVCMDFASGALGYQLQVPGSANYALISVGQVIELFVYTHVREDALDLFGFLTRSEKELFLTLTSVNGIGPKVGLGILSAMDAGNLVQAILTKNYDVLTSISGVGKKTAERICLELAEPLKKKFDAGLFGPVPLKVIQGAQSRGSGAQLIPNEGVWAEARDALVGLGYRENEVQILLRRVMEEHESTKVAKTEDVIRLALQRMPS